MSGFAPVAATARLSVADLSDTVVFSRQATQILISHFLWALMTLSPQDKT